MTSNAPQDAGPPENPGPPQAQFNQTYELWDPVSRATLVVELVDDVDNKTIAAPDFAQIRPQAVLTFKVVKIQRFIEEM